MKNNRLMLKVDGRILIVRQSKIDWIEADGSYVHLHFRNGSHHIRAQITQLEEELDENEFIRINRSAIVHLDFIQEMRPWLRGTYRTILKDGTELVLSRNYRDRLFSKLSKVFHGRNISPAKLG